MYTIASKTLKITGKLLTFDQNGKGSIKTITDISETLLIPLYARAQETLSKIQLLMTEGR